MKLNLLEADLVTLKQYVIFSGFLRKISYLVDSQICLSYVQSEVENVQL